MLYESVALSGGVIVLGHHSSLVVKVESPLTETQTREQMRKGEEIPLLSGMVQDIKQSLAMGWNPQVGFHTDYQQAHGNVESHHT